MLSAIGGAREISILRAIVLYEPKDLRIDEKERPSPAAGEVLVQIERGGICGSDLHYYRNGGFGTVRMREPLTLGHEIAGRVVALGNGVLAPAAGTLVAVNPSMPCGECEFCRAGLRIHCSNMRFLGSAMRFPHVQGGFSDYLVCPAENAVRVADGVDAGQAAFAEPLAVCLHAAGRAPVYGRRVLIMGAGPIGALLALVVRFAGAREIVVTDIADGPLAFARSIGADRTINVAQADALAPFEANKGYFDVVFEAAGQATTVETALRIVRPRGSVVLVGQGATAQLPVSAAVTKEINLCGSFRFDSEFQLAVDMIGGGRIDVSPLLSATLPAADAVAAFELAGDKSRSMKVQLAFA
jgi:L-idonate 5-dehydrogenase